MTSNEPALNLTYDELYEEAQSTLRVLSRNCSSPRMLLTGAVARESSHSGIP